MGKGGGVRVKSWQQKNSRLPVHVGLGESCVLRVLWRHHIGLGVAVHTIARLQLLLIAGRRVLARYGACNTAQVSAKSDATKKY